MAPDAPADHAGLREGDAITAVNGNKIEYWQQFMEATQASNGQPLNLDVERKGQTVRLVVTPKKGAADNGENVYQIGVVARRDAKSHTNTYPLPRAPRFAGAETVDTIKRTVDVVGKLFSGRVAIKQLLGPVGISHMAGKAMCRGPST